MGEGPGLEKGAKVEVTEVTAADPAQYDVDVVGLLREAVVGALAEKGDNWSGDPAQRRYALVVAIERYEKGNAFKRWLLPGFGATTLQLHCKLSDPANAEVLADFTHKRSVAAGGLYTVGAWKTIFNSAAQDLAVDLHRRLSGEPSGFFIELDPWPENETDVPKSAVSTRVQLERLADMRPEKSRIGERTAAFNVSMGSVYLNRGVADYMQEALRNELLASGNAVTDENPDVVVRGQIELFWIHTDTTPLYWDMVAEISVRLSAHDPASGSLLRESTYTADAKSRTYAWPTREFAGKVMAEAVRNTLYKVRADGIWMTGVEEDR